MNTELIAQLVKKLSERKGDGKDDDWLFACCHCLWLLATPETTEAVEPLLAIVNDEGYSNLTRFAAVAVLSRIGGERVKSALIVAKPFMQDSKAGKEVRGAIFDVLEGKEVRLNDTECMVKAVDSALIGVKLSIPKLVALARLGNNRKLTQHLLNQASGLEAFAKEIREGL